MPTTTRGHPLLVAGALAIGYEGFVQLRELGIRWGAYEEARHYADGR